MKAIRGFSILEVLLALSITLVVMAMVAQTLSHVAAIYDAQTDLATTGSTVAVALDDIVFEISLAGQGLGEGIPAVLPTLPGTRASASAITLRSNPDVTATFLLEALGENGEPTPADGASLFDKDDLVVVTDARGRVERVIVARAGEAALGLRSIDSADGELRGNYTPQSGARVLALREVHYFLDEAKGGELVKNVEGVSRRVLARGVTGLSFEYLGREGETIALAKAETSGELATVRVTITYEAGEEGLPARSLATAVTPAPRSGTVDFEQHDARFRLSRTFYPLDRPTGVASRIGADWAVVLCSGVNPTSDPASLFSFQVEKRFLGAGVDNVTYLDDVRAPVTLAFAPETGRLSGSLFIAAWGLRIGHLSRIAPDAYGKLSAESEMTTFEGTDAIAQSGGMAFGVDEALYVTSREKGAIYRFRFEALGKPSKPERMFPVTGTPGAIAEGTDGHLYFLMNQGLVGSLWKMAFDETLTPLPPVRVGTLPGTGVALARDPVEGNLFALVTVPASQTTKKLEEYLSRRLEEFELAALMMDGLEVAGQTVVVTLGITIDGTKVPLGIWLGSTENSRVCTAMLQNLLERGLRIDESILCVVDGGKGIRKALVDVLGDLVVIQRCQLHKLRNLRSYLPKSRHAYVLQTMKEAYKCKSADKARKRLQALVSWLERNGYDEAAGSLREGMEETLTVVKLALPELLRKSLATTNAIENLNGTIRRVSRNVKRWKSPSMIRRWTALGVVTAEKKFHRIKGYRHMGALVHALRSKQKSLDSDEVAA